MENASRISILYLKTLKLFLPVYRVIDIGDVFGPRQFSQLNYKMDSKNSKSELIFCLKKSMKGFLLPQNQE